MQFFFYFWEVKCFTVTQAGKPPSFVMLKWRSLLTIVLLLGRVLYILDATFDTWSILASTLSCSVNLEKGKRIFNNRLQAHIVVENAFGILALRWRVFLTTIKLSPEKVTDIIFAACCLLNVMTEKNERSYTSAADLENADYTLVRRTWRSLEKYSTDRKSTR